MKKVAARPASAGKVKWRRANTPVANAVANIKGRPAAATGKAYGLGGSDREKFSIHHAL